jgi:hypothetical protein
MKGTVRPARARQHWRGWAAALALLAAGGALADAPPAADGAAPASARQLVDALTRQYPPGSITTTARAELALADARAAHARLQAEFEAQRRHCAGVFFVNRCMDTARHAQRAGEQQVRAVTLESHDLQRHLDAIAHADSRAQEERQEAADAALRPDRERQAALSARTREENASARAEDAKRDQEKAAQDSAATASRARAQQADVARKDALRPQQEAAALHDFQDKQAQAAAYAKTRAQDREANAKRRTERETARDAAAAADARPTPPPPPANPPPHQP